MSRPTWDDSGTEWIGIVRAAKMVYMHPNTLRRWAEKGLIKYTRVGVRNDRRFRKSDVLKFARRYVEGGIEIGMNIKVTVLERGQMKPVNIACPQCATVIRTTEEHVRIYKEKTCDGCGALLKLEVLL